ncbi:hypothetical protein CK203_092449 [Vitis vinifera]|uniref:Uncharacterized protein n=1 Tax=Vitis vinifera TaxID=29760 RepID=A0A438DYA0_VITVI|nr:hypothetical protein CK203_092449 [Vitis vinifera]
MADRKLWEMEKVTGMKHGWLGGGWSKFKETFFGEEGPLRGDLTWQVSNRKYREEKGGWCTWEVREVYGVGVMESHQEGGGCVKLQSCLFTSSKEALVEEVWSHSPEEGVGLLALLGISMIKRWRARSASF